MSGDQFDRIFSDSIGGSSYRKPLGIADVAWNGICWSIKTVKNKFPHKAREVRLISGRNSPSYSSGIDDPQADIHATGRSVIDIYNARIDESKAQHNEARMLVLIRNMDTCEFTIFEREINRYAVNNFSWQVNERKNLQAYEGQRHAFTWQPHGSQFTILEPVPASATRFRITKKPSTLDMNRVLSMAKFELGWIEIL